MNHFTDLVGIPGYEVSTTWLMTQSTEKLVTGRARALRASEECYKNNSTDVDVRLEDGLGMKFTAHFNCNRSFYLPTTRNGSNMRARYISAFEA